MSDESDQLDAKALEIATGFKSVTNDGQTVVSQDIDEVIKAKKLLASQGASSRPHFGLRMTQLKPGGCG